MKVKSSRSTGHNIMKCPRLHRPKKPVKGKRYKKMRRPFWIESMETGIWFNLESGQWGPYPTKEQCISSYYVNDYWGFHDAFSLKAVLRLIKKWNVPQGTKFRAALPFVGYEFIITK